MRELTVQTDCGLIKGMEENGALAWKGIPYAQPPVRFSAPQPVEKWSGVRDGTRFGPSCPQENEKRAPMAEDCLVSEYLVAGYGRGAARYVFYPRRLIRRRERKMNRHIMGRTSRKRRTWWS